MVPSEIGDQIAFAGREPLTRLRDYHITRIVSSPAVRCLQTVEPLAGERGLPSDLLHQTPPVRRLDEACRREIFTR